VLKNVTVTVILFVNFLTKNCSHHGLDYTIKKIDKFDPMVWKSGCSRPRTARHDDDIDAVTDLVQSQQDKL